MGLTGKIIFSTSKGFIEEVNTNTSFNIYRLVGSLKEGRFYKSAYNIDTAKKHLNKLNK